MSIRDFQKQKSFLKILATLNSNVFSFMVYSIVIFPRIVFFLSHIFTLGSRNQSRNSCQSCRHSQHFTVTPDAEVLEREAPDLKKTGNCNVMYVVILVPDCLNEL